MKFLSSFTHTYVIPNFYEFLSYAEHIKNVDNQTIDGHLLP